MTPLLDPVDLVLDTDPPTLRDRFAMAALTGLLANATDPVARIVELRARVGAYAYEIADAMLAARERKEAR